MTSKVLALGAFLVALLTARLAVAQTMQADSPSWLKDRRYSEGIGIRAGDLELHPGIAGEVGYDSNWLLRTDRTQCAFPPPPAPLPAANVSSACANGPPVVPALEFRVTPSFFISTLGPQRREEDVGASQPDVTFRAGVSATWREFANISGDTGANDISQQNSGLPSGSADARLNILPGRPVGGAIFGNYTRVFLPNQISVDPNLAWSQDMAGGGGELALQPGSGTLDWHFGYQYQATLFEQTEGVGYDNYTHQAFTRGRWRFRPRTALLYDASLGFVSYSNPDRAAQQGLVSSTPVRMRIGLNGLVTDRFALLALVGWASSLYDTSVQALQPQYDSVIGQGELTWFLSGGPGLIVAPDVALALSSISLGYNRDFANSYIGNFYGSDRGYLRFSYFFAGRALLTLEGGVGAIEYPTMYWLPQSGVPAGTFRHDAFTDVRADGTLFAEYRFSDSFGLNTTLRYTANLSNTHDVPSSPGGAVYDMAWNRFEAFLGVRWFM